MVTDLEKINLIAECRERIYRAREKARVLRETAAKGLNEQFRTREAPAYLDEATELEDNADFLAGMLQLVEENARS